MANPADKSGTITGSNSTQVRLSGPSGDGNGAFATLICKGGTWGGGSVKLQVSPDDTIANAVDIAGATLSADGYINFQVKGASYWLVATGVTSVPWWIF